MEEIQLIKKWAVSSTLVLLFFTTGVNAAPIPLKLVRIQILEALSNRDTTSSDKFRLEFEASIRLSQKLANTTLQKCGYVLESQFVPFSANDPLQAYETAALAEKNGAWMIIGPRRSSHYLLVIRGAPKTPSVSIMASATELEIEAPLHLPAKPSNSSLARAAVQIVVDSTPRTRRNYFTTLSDDCVMCKDFSLQFDLRAKGHLTKLGQISVIGENPDPSPVLEAIERTHPNWVLLPNFSKASAILMGAIHSKFPKIQFLGGDGWGDGKFGFIERNPYAENISGITVRGFPPSDVALPLFHFGRLVIANLDSGAFKPSSGPGVSILRVYQGLSDLLCDMRPPNSELFRNYFITKGAHYFAPPWGVSAYKLKNGQIIYWKSIP